MLPARARSIGWHSPAPTDRRSFLLTRAQPGLVGLIDGSLSSLAPIFAVAVGTHTPKYAFFAGLATALGAAVSMAFSEGLSDSGLETGRGRPATRGAITGGGTFVGGFLHTLPFLIPTYRAALVAAAVVVGLELVLLAYLRHRFFGTGFGGSLRAVTLGGVIIVLISVGLGSAASG
jgi:VIT1/CCC1 family predicted Fe2+/Mn2+ transporter